MSAAEKFYGKTDYWHPRSTPMEVKILKRSENLLKVKVEGEKHTLFSPLRKELLKEEDVEFVAFRAEHPLLESVVFEVRTKTKKPLKVIEDAVNRMRETLTEYQQEFKKAFTRGRTNPEFIQADKWEEYLEEM